MHWVGWYRNVRVLAQHAIRRGRHVAFLQVLVAIRRERAGAFFYLELRDAESQIMSAEIDQHVLTNCENVTLEHICHMLSQCLCIDWVLNLQKLVTNQN